MWRTTRNFSKTYAETVSAFLASRQRNEKDSIAQRPLSPGPTLAGDTWMRRKKPSCSGDKMYSVCQYLSVYARPTVKDTCVLEGTAGPEHPCLAILIHTYERRTLAYVPVLLEMKAWGFLDIVFVVAEKKCALQSTDSSAIPVALFALDRHGSGGKCWSQTGRFATLEISLFPWHSRNTAHQGTQKAPEIYFCT